VGVQTHFSLGRLPYDGDCGNDFCQVCGVCMQEWKRDRKKKRLSGSENRRPSLPPYFSLSVEPSVDVQTRRWRGCRTWPRPCNHYARVMSCSVKISPPAGPATLFDNGPAFSPHEAHEVCVPPLSISTDAQRPSASPRGHNSDASDAFKK
jgi:hypothetical protein